MKQSPQDIHFYQKEIIGKLALESSLPFSGLNIDGLESEHMNYHLKKLIDLGYVEKVNEKYQLTDLGKDFSNLLDDDMKMLEKQPKTSVLINAVREGSNGELQYLMSRRLRQPYFGKVGRLTGKVRFGETLWEAAERELYEETGLKAQESLLERVYHKIRYREDGSVVQDILFYTFFMSGLEGNMIEHTKHQDNFWVSRRELGDRQKFDLFDDIELREDPNPRELHFTEERSLAEGY